MQASALISSYRAGEFLRNKIINIMRSTIDMQIIIVECNSGCDVNSISDLIGHHNIKVKIFDKRISIWRAINEAIKLSDFEFVVQANTDDLVSENAYEKQINALKSGADIVYFDYYITDGYFGDWGNAKNNHYTYYETPDNGYSEGCGLGMFPMWRKSLHDEVGYFDDKLEICGDSLFWHNLRENSKKFKRIPEKLGAYAQRSGHNLESNIAYVAKDKVRLEALRSNPKR